MLPGLAIATVEEALRRSIKTAFLKLNTCAIGFDNTFGHGAEILSFGHLMQQARARASVASLGSVDDDGTQILMNAFYVD